MLQGKCVDTSGSTNLKKIVGSVLLVGKDIQAIRKLESGANIKELLQDQWKQLDIFSL